MKLKELVNIDKYLDFARELRKMWNMNLSDIIPIVVGSLGTVCKDPKRRLREPKIRSIIETTQTIILLKLAKIPRRVLET